jgi:hypothetical protein
MLDLMAIGRLAGLGRGAVRRAAAHQGQPGAVLGGAGRRRDRRLRGARWTLPAELPRPVRRAHHHARAPGQARSRERALESQPARARRLGQPRPAHSAGRPAGHGRGAGRPGGRRPARGVPVPLADPPRGGPAHRDDRRPVRAVPHPRGRAAADPSAMVGLEDLVAEVVASTDPVAGPRASGSPGPRCAACRSTSTRRDGPGPAQPGHQRDPAHPADGGVDVLA